MFNSSGPEGSAAPRQGDGAGVGSIDQAWDAVVVGAGIGGLGTAALLTRAGLRVLVLEAAKDIGGRAYSFTHRGHILNVGGPRAGLVGRKVDALFAALDLPIPDREEFDGIIHHRDGQWMDLTDLATRAEPSEALAWLQAVEGVTDADLVALDDVPADRWLAQHVHDPDLVDLVRYGAVAMCTLPRLEDMAASTVVAAMRIVQTMPRIYLATRGYGDFMAALAQCCHDGGGDVRTRTTVRAVRVDQGRAVGVTVEDRAGACWDIDAPVVVSGVPVWQLGGLLGPGVLDPEVQARLCGLEATTAVFGITAALRAPAYEGRHFVLGDAPRAGFPLAGYMATNVVPALAPEGEHLLEMSCVCDRELGQFKDLVAERCELMIQDLEALFPGWTEEVIWMQRSFHWVESARTPGREGVHRFGVTLPGVEGLYLTGDTVASRALPGLETAADAAVLCARAVTDGAR
jgi:phytoene dehydrogenase-like protein